MPGPTEEVAAPGSAAPAAWQGPQAAGGGHGGHGGPPAALRPGLLKPRCQIAAAAGRPGPPVTVALPRAGSARRRRQTESQPGRRAQAGAALTNIGIARDIPESIRDFPDLLVARSSMPGMT